MNTEDLIQGLLTLQNNYARTRRAIVTGERLQHILKREDSSNIDVKNEEIREPLLEHVGHLPIIASFLHPHIIHSKEVDLGRVLVMLSIHDIGETVTGDTIAYKKTDKQVDEENHVVKDILPEVFRKYFEEFEERQSFDAKYAKSVDSLAPFLHELDMPKLTKKRFEVWDFGSKKIEAKKKPLFQWDPVLKDIFDLIIDEFRRIESGKPTKFTSIIDLE